LKYLELGRVKTLRPEKLKELLKLLTYQELGRVEILHPKILKDF